MSHFRVSNCVIKPKVAFSLLQSLSVNRSLQALELDGICLSDDSVQVLTGFLLESRLEQLQLKATKLTLTKQLKLVEVISRMKWLTDLDLSENTLTQH